MNLEKKCQRDFGLLLFNSFQTDQDLSKENIRNAVQEALSNPEKIQDFKSIVNSFLEGGRCTPFLETILQTFEDQVLASYRELGFDGVVTEFPDDFDLESQGKAMQKRAIKALSLYAGNIMAWRLLGSTIQNQLMYGEFKNLKAPLSLLLSSQQYDMISEYLVANTKPSLQFVREIVESSKSLDEHEDVRQMVLSDLDLSNPEIANQYLRDHISEIGDMFQEQGMSLEILNQHRGFDVPHQALEEYMEIVIDPKFNFFTILQDDARYKYFNGDIKCMENFLEYKSVPPHHRYTRRDEVEAHVHCKSGFVWIDNHEAVFKDVLLRLPQMDIEDADDIIFWIASRLPEIREVSMRRRQGDENHRQVPYYSSYVAVASEILQKIPEDERAPLCKKILWMERINTTQIEFVKDVFPDETIIMNVFLFIRRISEPNFEEMDTSDLMKFITLFVMYYISKENLTISDTNRPSLARIIPLQALVTLKKLTLLIESRPDKGDLYNIDNLTVEDCYNKEELITTEPLDPSKVLYRTVPRGETVKRGQCYTLFDWTWFQTLLNPPMPFTGGWEQEDIVKLLMIYSKIRITLILEPLIEHLFNMSLQEYQEQDPPPASPMIAIPEFSKLVRDFIATDEDDPEGELISNLIKEQARLHNIPIDQFYMLLDVPESIVPDDFDLELEQDLDLDEQNLDLDEVEEEDEYEDEYEDEDEEDEN